MAYRVLRQVPAVLVVLAMLAASFVILRAVTLDSFEELEESQVAGHATVLGATLDSRTQRLLDFGATNTLWDDSYEDLRDAHDR